MAESGVQIERRKRYGMELAEFFQDGPEAKPDGYSITGFAIASESRGRSGRKLIRPRNIEPHDRDRDRTNAHGIDARRFGLDRPMQELLMLEPAAKQ